MEFRRVLFRSPECLVGLIHADIQTQMRRGRLQGPEVSAQCFQNRGVFGQKPPECVGGASVAHYNVRSELASIGHAYTRSPASAARDFGDLCAGNHDSAATLDLREYGGGDG